MSSRCLLHIALAGGLILSLVGSASAQKKDKDPDPPKNPWHGAQPGSFSGGCIFEVNGDVVTVTADLLHPTYLTLGGQTKQLLGMSRLWIVDQNGNTVLGVSATAPGGADGGVVTGSKPSATWTSVTDPAGYDAGDGFGATTPWLQLASNADLLAGSGKSPSGYTAGTFTFTGLSSLSGYYWGIDYLIADGAKGQTGRAYCATDCGDLVITAVPEPSEYAVVTLFAGSLVGMVIRARRRRA